MTHFFRHPLLLLVVSLVAALAGCSTVSPLGAINVTAVDIRPVDASLLESRAILVLRYLSEHPTPVAFSGTTHKLYLNGSYVGRAVSKDPIGLPPFSSVTQETTLYLENLALLRQLQALQDKPAVTYRLESTLFFTAGTEDGRVSSNSQGSLDLSPLLRAQ